MLRTKLRGLILALVIACVGSGAVLSSGCSKEEQAPKATEDARKGQEEAFRNRQGGAR